MLPNSNRMNILFEFWTAITTLVKMILKCGTKIQLRMMENKNNDQGINEKASVKMVAEMTIIISERNEWPNE